IGQVENMSVEGLFVHGGDLWRLNTPLSCLQPPQQGKTHKHIVVFIIPLYGYCVDSAISTITFILVKSMRQFNIPTELSYIISFIINILYR
ncbi:hypothetical protein, partial [Escherichia coli]|uniref:hypothetical protein n=1 Tax=Escherichia coli TaxID=562 RepID=UPI001BC9D0A3